MEVSNARSYGHGGEGALMLHGVGKARLALARLPMCGILCSFPKVKKNVWRSCPCAADFALTRESKEEFRPSKTRRVFVVQGCISGLNGRTPFEQLRLDHT